MEDMAQSRWSLLCSAIERLWLRRLGQRYTMIGGAIKVRGGGIIWGIHINIALIVVIVIIN